MEVKDGNGNFIGSAGAVVKGAEFTPQECASFNEGAYNTSELLTLEISPTTVSPGSQIEAKVTYDFSHPLAVDFNTITVYCALTCGVLMGLACV